MFEDRLRRYAHRGRERDGRDHDHHPLHSTPPRNSWICTAFATERPGVKVPSVKSRRGRASASRASFSAERSSVTWAALIDVDPATTVGWLVQVTALRPPATRIAPTAWRSSLACDALIVPPARTSPVNTTVVARSTTQSDNNRPLFARTRYRYVVIGWRPESVNEFVADSPTFAYGS